MTLVIDASVALKWFLPDEPDSEIALAIVREGDILIAPDLVVAEVCNAAWKSARLGLISPTQVHDIADELPRFFSALAPTAPLANRAAAIAGQLDHPVYGAFYVALAERENARLITADARLAGKLSGAVWEKWTTLLATYQPASGL